MQARLAKTAMVASLAAFALLVAYGNVADYGSNFEFVRHVLSMDTTFPGNRGMWRALDAPAFHLAFYIGVIGWEAVNMALGWAGAFALFRARNTSLEVFTSAKRIGVVALTSGILLWLVAFITVGGEWFLMWQSHIWNGQDAAFRMFTVEAIILILLLMPEPSA